MATLHPELQVTGASTKLYFVIDDRPISHKNSPRRLAENFPAYQRPWQALTDNVVICWLLEIVWKPFQ